MSDVWVKIKFDPELRERFRRWAFNNNTSMQEALVSAAQSLCNGKIERKPKVVGAVPVAKPSIDDFADPGEVLMGKCSKCLDNFLVTALISYPQFPNKKFCPGCVENMKNGQG